jgi:hypothetical protein
MAQPVYHGALSITDSRPQLGPGVRIILTAVTAPSAVGATTMRMVIWTPAALLADAVRIAEGSWLEMQ